MAAIAQPGYMPEAQAKLTPLLVYEQLTEKTVGGYSFLMQSDEKCRNYVVVLNDAGYSMTWEQILRFSYDNRMIPTIGGFDFGGKFYSRGKKYDSLIARLESDNLKLSELLNTETKTITEQVEVIDWRSTFSICVKLAFATYILAFVTIVAAGIL